MNLADVVVGNEEISSEGGGSEGGGKGETGSRGVHVGVCAGRFFLSKL